MEIISALLLLGVFNCKYIHHNVAKTLFVCERVKCLGDDVAVPDLGLSESTLFSAFACGSCGFSGFSILILLVLF